MKTNLNDIQTMCVVAKGGPETSKVAFDKLESKLGSLRSRKFYGVLHKGIYRACVELMEGDNPEELGFERYTIPGGEYAQEKIQDWTKHISEIGSTFSRLEEEFTKDEDRPEIEFYRSQIELILLLPIK